MGYSDLARQLIYTQMMLPLKVSMLSEKIATVYLEVSDKYILPAQRYVFSPRRNMEIEC